MSAERADTSEKRLREIDAEIKASMKREDALLDNLAKGAPTLEEVMGSYDWKEVMKYAQFKFDDIERVIFSVDGEPDESDWLLIAELKGGGFGAVRAGCDYTGWGCQEGGDSGKFESEAQARLWLRNRNRWTGDSADERVPL